MRSILKDKLFLISISALIVSCLLLRKLPSYDLSDLSTVYFLFLLFLSTKSLETTGVFSRIAWSFGGRSGMCIIIATGFLSALVTNDVALLIAVPITVALDMNSRDKEKLVILETIVANGFSALTPFGNPQNVFIHFHYSLGSLSIPLTVFPLSISTLLLAAVLARDCRIERDIEISPPRIGWIFWFDLLFFSIVLLAILDLIPDPVSLISLLYFVLIRKKSLKLVDYPLLFSFLAFFGFTDNVSHALNLVLRSPNTVFLTSLSLSQVISNVPATLVLADFTRDWRALLWGVSVGGFGTLVASMANLISYRMFKFDLVRFTLYNVVFLVLGIVVYYLVQA